MGIEVILYMRDIKELPETFGKSYYIKEDSKEDLLSSIECIDEPKIKKSDLEKELGRTIQEGFYRTPTEHKMFSNKNSSIEYPLLLIDNVGCEEILNSFYSSVNKSTAEGKDINVCLKTEGDNVSYLGKFKVDMNSLNTLKCLLCKVTYYESKGVIADIQYEDFINFDEMIPKILIEDEDVISYKEKSIPNYKTKLTDEIIKDPLAFQMKILSEIQGKIYGGKVEERINELNQPDLIKDILATIPEAWSKTSEKTDFNTVDMTALKF